MTFAVRTLGCKVNAYESRAVAESLSRAGFREAAAGEAADFVVINSCCVTAESARKTRQAARRARADHPGCAVVVTGCLASGFPEEAAEVGDLVVPHSEQKNLPALLLSLAAGNNPSGAGNKVEPAVRGAEGEVAPSALPGAGCPREKAGYSETNGNGAGKTASPVLPGGRCPREEAGGQADNNGADSCETTGSGATGCEAIDSGTTGCEPGNSPIGSASVGGDKATNFSPGGSLTGGGAPLNGTPRAGSDTSATGGKATDGRAGGGEAGSGETNGNGASKTASSALPGAGCPREKAGGQVGGDKATNFSPGGSLTGDGAPVGSVTAGGDNPLKGAPGDGVSAPPVTAFPGHTRAILKIEDGCDNACAYCVIPACRGGVRSKPPETVAAEAAALGAAGYKEIVLVGINLSSYGKGELFTLADAVDAVSGAPGVERVRPGSLEFDKIPRETLLRLAANPKFCPHFHLSLQSGSDGTLAAMRRPYTAAEYTEFVSVLRGTFPGAAVTTDIIVGFPGEEEEDFLLTAEFVAKTGFARTHIFPFSPRPGTPAATMPGQVPGSVKKERCARLRAVADEAEQRFLTGEVGRRVNVLFETLKDGLYEGYSENYTRVAVPAGGADPRGEILPVRLTAAERGRCLGTIE